MSKVVIGLDIGHGESTANYVVLRNSEDQIVDKPKIDFLNIKNSLPKIYSTITYYENDLTDIGNIDNRTIAYFKRSPLEWDKKCPNAGGKTYKEVMGDFIGKMVACLLNRDINPELAPYNKSELALYVGCPSDKTWTDAENRKAYEQLIRNYTGINDVTVAAESTAAIFSVISNNKKSKLNPSKGVAVFDFGSLTSDFTYVLLGKTLIEASWQLGASAIEANIVEKVLTDKLGDDYSSVYTGDLQIRQLVCRRDMKESWFGDVTTPGYASTAPDGKDVVMGYYECDEFGNLRTRKNARGIEKPIVETLNIDLNSDLIDAVIKEMSVPNVTAKGVPVDPTNSKSWYDLCKAFVTKCKNLIQNNGCPCKTIIVTGGASRMPFIKAICREVFGINVTVYCDESPSYCVCRGLCQIAINHNLMTSNMDSWKKDIKDSTVANIATYRNDVSDVLADYLFTEMLDAISTLPDNTTMATLHASLENRIKEDLPKNLGNLLAEPIKRLGENCATTIANTVDDAARVFYGTDANVYSPDIIIEQGIILRDFQFSAFKMIDTENIINAVLRFLGEVLAGIIAGLVAAGCLALPIPFLRYLIATMAYGAVYVYVRDFIVNNPNHRIRNMKKMATDLEERKTDLIEKIKNNSVPDIVDLIIKNQFGEDNIEFKNSLDPIIELAIQSVSLEHFDQVIQ